MSRSHHARASTHKNSKQQQPREDKAVRQARACRMHRSIQRYDAAQTSKLVVIATGTTLNNHIPNNTTILLKILKRITPIIRRITIQNKILTTKITNPNQIMLTNRTNILLNLNRNLQLTITTNTKPSSHMKTNNTFLTDA